MEGSERARDCTHTRARRPRSLSRLFPSSLRGGGKKKRWARHKLQERESSKPSPSGGQSLPGPGEAVSGLPSGRAISSELPRVFQSPGAALCSCPRRGARGWALPAQLSGIDRTWALLMREEEATAAGSVRGALPSARPRNDGEEMSISCPSSASFSQRFFGFFYSFPRR